MAATLVFGVTDELSDAPDEDLRRAEELATQALTASPNNALAHYVKGQVLFAQSRCGEAIPEYETAISLDRSRAPAYARLGWCKFLTGSIDQAIPYFEEAIHLSPHEPTIATWFGRMGVIYLLQSRTDEAIGWLEKANSENSRLAFVHAYLAAGYALRGEIERARAELAQAEGLSKIYSSLASVKKSTWYDDPEDSRLGRGKLISGTASRRVTGRRLILRPAGGRNSSPRSRVPALRSARSERGKQGGEAAACGEGGRVCCNGLVGRMQRYRGNGLSTAVCRDQSTAACRDRVGSVSAMDAAPIA